MTPNRIRSILQKIVRILFHILTRVEVKGGENLPEKGGYILASNHLSMLDPALAFAFLNRSDVTALVAKKHQKNPLIRPLINLVGGIWLNREEADTRAMRMALQYLKNGGILGISPEGTRSKTHALIRSKTGIAYLAEHTKVPILPVAIYGTENAALKILTLQRPRITIHFGKPFYLPSLGRDHRDSLLRQNTDEVMCRIAALLPPSYHGAYANHPRLAELLSPQEENVSKSVQFEPSHSCTKDG